MSWTFFFRKAYGPPTKPDIIEEDKHKQVRVMNSEQPDSPQTEISAEVPKKVPFWKHKTFIIIISILVVILAAGGVIYALLQTKGDPNSTPQTSATKPDITQPTVDTIYAFSEAKLVAINPKAKEFIVVDNNLDGESGMINLGSTTPLTAPNFQKAVYIKDGAGWITSGTQKKVFYSIPEVAKKTGFYTLYLSAWSSDSSKVAFAIGFMCPPIGSSCTDTDEDKNLTGVYVYDIASEKSSKVQATGVLQWLPGSSKIIYFDDASEPTKLLVNDTSTGSVSTSVAKDFGFAPLTSFSDDATKMIYSSGVNGTESAALYISNINGSEQKTLKQSTFADLLWPKFLPESNTDYAYSKRKEIKCYNGTSGCVSASLQIVKAGEDKKAVEDIDSKIIGFYKGKAIVVVSDGQVGLDPNNPSPYKANISLVDLTSFEATKIYEHVVQKGTEGDAQIRLRIGE